MPINARLRRVFKIKKMEKTYKFNTQEVNIERWAWAVVYNDGTQLRQFGDDGIFHQIGEVNQGIVKLFVMYKPEDERKRIDIVFQPGMRLIHKYRNVKPYYSDKFIKVYMFGYKYKNQYAYNFILPDDRIIQSPIDNIDLVQFELNRKE